MGQGGDRLAGLWRKDAEWVQKMVREMLDEDLLSEQSGDDVWEFCNAVEKVKF